MTVLSTFLESPLNFLSDNLKNYYNQGEKWCVNLNCQKHSLKRQSGTKLPLKPTSSKKMTILITFLKSSLNFLSNNLKKPVQSERKGCQSLNCQKHSLKRQSGTKSPQKPTSSKKNTILSTFLKSSLNFLSNNLKNQYNQREKQCQSLNCQKHSLKRQSGTKSPLKPTWSEKITVLSTFLESSLSFLSNNLKKKTQNLIQSESTAVSNVNCQKHSLKGQLGTKFLVKPTWSEKMTVLITFLESSLNFLSNNPKRIPNLVQLEGKVVSKFELPETQLEKTVRDKIACQT